MQDESFFEVAQDGREICIDLERGSIHLDERKFQFQLSQMERELFKYGGISSAFRLFGNQLFGAMTSPRGPREAGRQTPLAGPHAKLQW